MLCLYLADQSEVKFSEDVQVALIDGSADLLFQVFVEGLAGLETVGVALDLGGQGADVLLGHRDVPVELLLLEFELVVLVDLGLHLSVHIALEISLLFFGLFELSLYSTVV